MVFWLAQSLLKMRWKSWMNWISMSQRSLGVWMRRLKVLSSKIHLPLMRRESFSQLKSLLRIAMITGWELVATSAKAYQQVNASGTEVSAKKARRTVDKVQVSGTSTMRAAQIHRIWSCAYNRKQMIHFTSISSRILCGRIKQQLHWLPGRSCSSHNTISASGRTTLIKILIWIGRYIFRDFIPLRPQKLSS